RLRVLGRGRPAHDHDVGAQPAVQDAGERVRQRRRDRPARRRHHDDVYVDREDLVAHLGSWLTHWRPSVDVHERTLQVRDAAALEVERAGRLDGDLWAADLDAGLTF